MKKWASTTGWNQDKRLAALIPPSKVPAYNQSQPSKNATSLDSKYNFRSITPIIVVGVAIAAGGVFGYRFYASHKKIPRKNI